MAKTITELLDELRTIGSAATTFQIAYLYDTGELLPINYKLAFCYYLKTLATYILPNDQISSNYKIAAGYHAWLLYLGGHGTFDSNEQGINALSVAADNGNMDALYHLGLAHHEGNCAPQDFAKAHYYYKLAAELGHANAQYGLGTLYYYGLGVLKNQDTAVEWFRKAVAGGNLQAKFFLQTDVLSVWPNAEWLSKKESGPIGQVYGEIAGMQKLRSALDLYRATTSNNPELFFEQQTMKALIDPDLLYWLELISIRDPSEGHYLVGKYALNEINVLKSGFNVVNFSNAMHARLNKNTINPFLGGVLSILNIIVISPLLFLLPIVMHFLKIITLRSLQKMFGDLPAQKINWLFETFEYFFNPDIIERYIKLYALSKSELNRALRKGYALAEVDLKVLEQHKEYVEVFRSNSFAKYSKKVQQSDLVLEEIYALMDKAMINRRLHIKLQSASMQPKLNDMLSKFIEELNFGEFKLWIKLVLDPDKLQSLLRNFYSQALRDKKYQLATDLLLGENFNINYLIEELDMSPVDLMIEHGSMDVLKDMLIQNDIDVNFNNPLFRAACKGNVEAVALLLAHSEIIMDVRQQFEGRLMTAHEVAIMRGHTNVATLIHEYQLRNTPNNIVYAFMSLRYKPEHEQGDPAYLATMPNITTRLELNL